MTKKITRPRVADVADEGVLEQEPDEVTTAQGDDASTDQTEEAPAPTDDVEQLRTRLLAIFNDPDHADEERALQKRIHDLVSPAQSSEEAAP